MARTQFRMLSDAPYELRDGVLTVPAGIAAGLISGAALLAVYGAQRPLDLLLSTAFGSGGRAGLAGALAVAALLGLLFGLSQLSSPPFVTVGVGVLYGLFLFLAGAVLGRLFLPSDLLALVRTWPWFFGCLTYGFCVGLLGVVGQRGRASRTTKVLRD